MSGLTPTFSDPTDTGSADGQSDATATEGAPEGQQDGQADGQAERATAVDQDGAPVDVDIVELGQRYEEVRMSATDHGKANKEFTAQKRELERELLTAFIDSDVASLSIVMPGSRENRVLTPTWKIWPKIRPIEGADADDKGNVPQYDEAARIAALRAAGLGHLVVEKIDGSGLNELFAGFATAEDMPDELRKVYDLTREWSISSTKGRAGRITGPTAAEVAQGRSSRPR